MSFLERLNNIYVVDTQMWGFEHYMSAYLVVGKEIALIDTGQPNRIEAVRAGIKAHGFSFSDISHIFVTHCEHADHAGNVTPILRESPKASVYINPAGRSSMFDPNKQIAARRARDNPEVAAMRTDMEPVPSSRIKDLNDGDVFDLGNDEKLKVIFAAGHQPSGIAIFEEKNTGLFISDLVGGCFTDADAHYPFCSVGTDYMKTIESINKLMDLPLSYLYLGHYGISDKPKQIMTRSIADIGRLLEMGKQYIHEGKLDSIAGKMLEMLEPELQKLRMARGEKIYQYATGNHQRKQSQNFTEYCKNKFGKE
jgi:glyoxylase-like metal-dependent hydrolase (beta-lactamase superfamily II)